MELAEVSHGSRQPLVKLGANLDVAGLQRIGPQPEGCPHYVIDIDIGSLGRGLAGEGKQPVHDVSNPSAALQDSVRSFLHLLGDILLRQQLGIANDPSQGIVNLVGDTCCHSADGGQAVLDLRLPS